MYRFISFISIIPALLCADSAIETAFPLPELPYEAWFTAPFLAPTSVNMEVGHPAIQPSLTVFNTYGHFTSDWKLHREETMWTINPLVDFQFATSKRTGIEIIASFATNIKDGKSSTHFLDTTVLLGFQVSNEEKNSWVPNFRCLLQTIFPSGKHDRLDPLKEGIDLTGLGAYFFGPNLAFSKLFQLPKNFFILHWSLGYFFPTEAHVKGFNAYGGGIGTKGEIRPGQLLSAYLSGEYSLNQHWVLSFDTSFLYQRESSRFKGSLGVLPTGLPAEVGLPSSIQISFAPQIEYNFNDHSGILFGTWFSIAGRNTNAFASLFFAYLYIF